MVEEWIMGASFQTPPAEPGLPPPPQPKGRVLFIGASYYNNWYLSRELRRLGWQADTFVCSGEGAENYIHGSDYYYSYVAGPYPVIKPELFDRITQLSRDYIQWARRGSPAGERPEVKIESLPPKGSSILDRVGSLFQLLIRSEDTEKPSTVELLARLHSETNPGRLRDLLRLFLKRVQPQPHPHLHRSTRRWIATTSCTSPARTTWASSTISTRPCSAD